MMFAAMARMAGDAVASPSPRILPFWSRLGTAANKRFINLGNEFYSDVLDGEEPAVHVKGYDANGNFVMANGQVVRSPLVCYGGKVFVWRGVGELDDVTERKLSLLRAVKPKPDILVVGAGKTAGKARLEEDVRKMLYDLNVSVEVVDTRTAISTFNILQQEGRRVVAAMIPAGPSQ